MKSVTFSIELQALKASTFNGCCLLVFRMVRVRGNETYSFCSDLKITDVVLVQDSKRAFRLDTLYSIKHKGGM